MANTIAVKKENLDILEEDAYDRVPQAVKPQALGTRQSIPVEPSERAHSLERCKTALTYLKIALKRSLQHKYIIDAT